MGCVRDKVVLVTGGGGSIGSELCRQLAGHGVRQLIIFDMYENNAYEIQQELKRNVPDLNLVVLIGSVRNTNRLDYLFRTYRPDIVYHAAAHKHVPLMEDSPNEAIKNNVLGTYKTARAAMQYGTGRFILISTDKAVNPANIMGASKRLCEMVIQMCNQKSGHGAARFLRMRFLYRTVQSVMSEIFRRFLEPIILLRSAIRFIRSMWIRMSWQAEPVYMTKRWAHMRDWYTCPVPRKTALHRSFLIRHRI